MDETGKTSNPTHKDKQVLAPVIKSLWQEDARIGYLLYLIVKKLDIPLDTVLTKGQYNKEYALLDKFSKEVCLCDNCVAERAKKGDRLDG